MEVIWSLFLTVCLTEYNCRYQDVQWFDTEKECLTMKTVHEEIPVDGDWKKVEYNCKPVGAKPA